MTPTDRSLGDVRLERHDAVAVVTLDRPQKRNALTLGMRARLAELLAALDADGDTRVIVLTGAGEGFCAGVDLSEGGTSVAGHPLADAPAAVTASLDALRTPILAAINGAAVGGGLELALACDLRIAADSARLGLTEVRIGSLAGSGGIQRLSRAVAPAVAARMVLTGELVDAAEALRIGLVSDVVPAADLLDRALDLATRIASNAPLSLIAAKQSLRAAGEVPLSSGLALDRMLWGWLAGSEDRAEGRAAFREGRRPTFRGR